MKQRKKHLPLQGKAVNRMKNQARFMATLQSNSNCRVCCSMSNNCPGCSCSSIRRGN